MNMIGWFWWTLGWFRINRRQFFPAIPHIAYVAPEVTLPTVVLWVDTPRSVLEAGLNLQRFYESIRQVVESNTFNKKITELVIRVEQPDTRCRNPWTCIYGKPAESLLYTHLLRHLPAETQIRFYPYLAAIDEGVNYQVTWADRIWEDRTKFIIGVFDPAEIPQ